MHRQFQKRNSDVNLKVTIPDEPLMVTVDAMLIEQVIMNLLDNAAKHAEGMTELRLDVKCSGSRALSRSQTTVPDLIRQ